MKKLFLLLLPLLFVPFFTNARSISDLRFEMPSSLAGICPSGDYALACIHYNTKTIYLSPKINPDMLKFVLCHEIAHYLAQDTTYQEYQAVFGKDDLHYLEEQMANNFYYFLFLNFMMTPQQNQFYLNLLTE